MAEPAPLERIPSPASSHWREFRIKVFPVLFFLIAAVGTFHLWKTISPGSRIAGISEGLRSIVSNPRSGVIKSLHVVPFQWVEAGTPILTVQPQDPNAELDLLQSELQLSRLLLEPTTADRNALDFEQIRIAALRLKEELALSRVNLERAESALRRNELLVKDKLVSEDAYDLSKRDRDYFQAEIEEKTKASKEIEGRLNYLRSLGDPTSPGSSKLPLAVISRLQTRLASAETNWNPITVYAPISGIVHLVYRQTNEFALEGEPLLTINSPNSDRIVAYLREPSRIEPKLGMEVQVMRRTNPRQIFTTRVAQVGPQVEVITNALAYIRQGALVDVGLPIVLPIPANVAIRPGEIVDVELVGSPGVNLQP